MRVSQTTTSCLLKSKSHSLISHSLSLQHDTHHHSTMNAWYGIGSGLHQGQPFHSCTSVYDFFSRIRIMSVL